MSDNGQQVPLIERLGRVPAAARVLEHTHNPLGYDTASIPVGALCREAADRIAELEGELETAQRERDEIRARSIRRKAELAGVRALELQRGNALGRIAVALLGNQNNVSDDAVVAAAERVAGELAAVREVVNAQAEDDGLWFVASTAPEAYLQQELRRLHAVIEGDAARAAQMDGGDQMEKKG